MKIIFYKIFRQTTPSGSLLLEGLQLLGVSCIYEVNRSRLWDAPVEIKVLLIVFHQWTLVNLGKE